MSRVLVISPHPDDEAIGCGGALRKHVEEGDSVQVIFLTSGEKGGHGRPEAETAVLREREARRASEILGLESADFWRLRDGAMRATKALRTRLAEKLRQFEPDIVYVTHDQEMHPDHQAAARLVRRALADQSDGADRPTILMYEVWTPMDRMTHIVDISPYIDVKLAAIRAHETQCSVLHFDDAMLGLARYRGEMHSWPGGDYAEVFREARR